MRRWIDSKVPGRRRQKIAVREFMGRLRMRPPGSISVSRASSSITCPKSSGDQTSASSAQSK